MSYIYPSCVLYLDVLLCAILAHAELFGHLLHAFIQCQMCVFVDVLGEKKVDVVQSYDNCFSSFHVCSASVCVCFATVQLCVCKHA